MDTCVFAHVVSYNKAPVVIAACMLQRELSFYCWLTSFNHNRSIIPQCGKSRGFPHSYYRKPRFFFTEGLSAISQIPDLTLLGIIEQLHFSIDSGCAKRFAFDMK